MRHGWKILVTLPLWWATAYAAQFMFLERTVTLKGDNRLYADWEFFSGLYPEPWSPKNWVSPVNYYQGSYHLEAQITAMTNTSADNDFCIGWKNYTVAENPQIPHNHTWEGYGKFRSPKTIIQDKALTDMWYGVDSGPTLGYADWNWTNAWGDFLYCYINPHGQNPFPVMVKVKLYIISNGSSYSPFTQTVAPPTAFPAGGTLNAPTYVWLSCATSGAGIYYCYPPAEPTTQSIPYDGPFKITATISMLVKAYKDGYNSSPEVTVNYVINNTDQTPPAVISATATSVRLVFNEQVHDKASPRAANFTIDQGISVTAAAIDITNMTTIDLTTSALATGNYILTMNGVRDLAGNVVPTNTQVPFGYGTGMGALPTRVRRSALPEGGRGDFSLFNAVGKRMGRASDGTCLRRADRPSGIYIARYEEGVTEKIILVK